MKIGSLVYATDQGLGILAKSFYDAGVITDVLVIPHRHHRNHLNWYPSATTAEPKQLAKLEVFIAGVDRLLFFETPFNWMLPPMARERGIKTFLMPMYECTPAKLPAQPDSFICPSLLDQRYFPERSTFIPVPVHGIKWRQRHKAEVFVHNAGYGGLKCRNGTGQLLDAMRYVKSPIKLILRAQKRLQWGVDDPRIDYRVGSVPYEELWDEGDVFIFPEKFNGLSLPLQEARAAGMFVMAGDRFPINTWLPQEGLIPVTGYVKNRIGPGYLEFDEAVISPQDIAAKIDQVYGQSIAEYSMLGRAWGQMMSWEYLKPKYMEVLCSS